MKKITIQIDNQNLIVRENQSILSIAQENNLDIPYLCYHPDGRTKKHCDLCLIKINGHKQLLRACETKARPGLKIETHAPEIEARRRTNLKKILDKHLLECDDCVWFLHCQLLKLVKRYHLPLQNKKSAQDKIWQTGEMVFDQTKCIGCGNCQSICPTRYLKINKEDKVELSPTEECVNCGQCIIHCPVGAMEGVGEFEQLENLFANPKKINVVQFAPAIRTSLGDEFGLPPGEIVTDQLVAGLKKLGFDYVFDTAIGADFAAQEEATELIKSLSLKNKLPLISSCCPAWVNFLEFYHPELIGNLCSTRSPQVILGGLVKTYWCQIKKIKPENITVTSIMPCIAKKAEIKRPELEINGQKTVDYVLTTRELFRLFKKKQIDLRTIKPQLADNPLGSPSGAGVIYGSSGGVFESALRTAYFQLTDKELSSQAIKNIRGNQGIRIKTIKIKNRTLKVCIVSGLKNAAKVIKEIKKFPQRYDIIEVMACPGGCIGGGGQPLPTTKEISRRRSQSLYTIDKNNPSNCARTNPVVAEVYKNFLTTATLRKKILHTKFAPAKRRVNRELANSRQTFS
jgi:iron-only hydrogenase group A